MVALVPPRAPWQPRAWRQALYLAGGIPAQLAGLLIVLIPWWLATGPNGQRVLGERSWAGPWPVPLLFLLVVFAVLPALTALHRNRMRSTADVAIPLQPAIPDRWSLAGMLAYASIPRHLAPARLPPGSRPGPGRGRDRRGLGLAGGPARHAAVHLRLDAAVGQPAVPRPVLAARPSPPDPARWRC